MLIEIAGGGAIGLSWAARLGASGLRVRVWTRTADQAEQLRTAGLRWQRGEEQGSVPVEASAADAEAAMSAAERSSETERWIVLALKSYHLNDDSVLAFVSALAGGGSPVVCLQNGIGHMERLREALPEAVFMQAVTSEGALREGPRTVRLTGEGQVRIEETAALPVNRQKMFVDKLNAAGIAALLSKNILNHVYGKLLINAVINPLTALYGVRNGELPEDPVRLSLMHAVHAESLAVLNVSGYEPDGAEWDRLLDVCRRTAANRSSMLADVRAGRRTEIEAVSGGIVRLARACGAPAPLNEALASLIAAAGPCKHEQDEGKWERCGSG